MGNNENDVLGQSMGDVDKEIVEIEKGLKELKKKEISLVSSLQTLHKQLEEVSLQEAFEKAQCLEYQNEDPEVEYRRRLVERFSYKNADVIKRIYATNREQAKKSHTQFSRFNYNGQDLKLPLYTQPSDLAVYHENKEKFKSFKPKLLMFLQRKCRAELKLEKHMEKQYEENKNNWIKMVEKMESNPKRKQKQQRARQFYEREFPEIKKHREQQERFDRLGSRSVGYIRSEAEVEEIADNLREKESSEKKMQLLAIMTPSLLNNYNRKIKYINNNGLIKNVEEFERKRKEDIIWSDKEKMIFAEKYTQYPKWFEKIASFLEVKSCADCVLFYYLNKKKQHFHTSKSKKKKGKMNRSVTMSLKLDQNKQKQNQQGQQGKEDINVELEDDDEEESVHSEDENTSAVNAESVGEAAETKIVKPEEEVKSVPPVTEAPVITEVERSSTPKPKPPPPQKIFNTRSGKFKSSLATPTKPASTESSSDKPVTVVSTADAVHPPLKITIVVTSPSNTEGQCSAVSVASIVSETVTAASMMAETTTSVPTSVESATQFNVEDLIRQHLSKMPEHSDPSRWSEGEMLKAVEGLKRFGRNWQLISQLVETKSEAQCKNFYFNYKKKFNLECILGISRTIEKGDSLSGEVAEESLVPSVDQSDVADQTKAEVAVEKAKQEKSESKAAKPDPRSKSSKNSSRVKSSEEFSHIDGSKVVNNEDNVVYHNVGVSSVSEVPPSSEPVVSTAAPAVAECAPPAVNDETPASTSGITHVQDLVSNLPSELNEHIEGEEKKHSESSPPPRPQPPPLFTHIQSPGTGNGTPRDECSPIPEISLKSDIGIFERKLESSIDPETLLKVSSPDVPATEEFKLQQVAAGNSKVDESDVKLRRSRGSLPDLRFVSRSPTHSSIPVCSVADVNQYTPFHSQRGIRPQMFTGQPPPPRPSHPGNRFQKRCQSRSVVEQSVAIQAFNSYQGYMTSLPQNASRSDVISPRFNYPISPNGNVVEHMPMVHSMSQTRPVMQHSQHSLPVAANSSQTNSPGMNTNKGFGQRHVDPISPMMQAPFRPHFSPDEMQKRREIELMHRQRESAELSELMHFRDRDGERDPQMRFRRQSELNFLHMKKMEYDKKLEEEAKQMRFRQQQKLFAQKFLEHEAMSQEMVHSLVQRHFNFDELTVDKQREPRVGSCPQDEVLPYQHEVREKYLRHLPAHPRNRDEMQQRTASIPSLRSNMNSLTEVYPSEGQLGRDRMRGNPLPEAVNASDQFAQELAVNRLASSRGSQDHLINRIATNQSPQDQLGNPRGSHVLPKHLGNRRTPPGSQDRMGNQRISSQDRITNQRASQSPQDRMVNQRMPHGSQDRLGYPLVSTQTPLEVLGNQRSSSQVSQERLISQRVLSQPPQELLGNQMLCSQGPPLSAMPYDKFGDLENPNITIPQISLEPLSRPGSANSEISSGSCPEQQRVYGISTGLVRKPCTLSSITGSSTLSGNENRKDTFSPDSHNSLSPSGRQSSLACPRVQTPVDQESSQRRSAIVRPWEIGAETPKLKDSSTQGAATQLIQLAPTTNKYKEQIINIAQKNSPAPQMFPKFNFRQAIAMHGEMDDIVNSSEVDTHAIENRPATSNSQILNDSNPGERMDDPDNEENFLIRPRSDSEETISADEAEVKDSIQCSESQCDDSQPVSSSLLIQRLNAVAMENGNAKHDTDRRENLPSKHVVSNATTEVLGSYYNGKTLVGASSFNGGNCEHGSTHLFESDKQVEGDGQHFYDGTSVGSQFGPAALYASEGNAQNKRYAPPKFNMPNKGSNTGKHIVMSSNKPGVELQLPACAGNLVIANGNRNASRPQSSATVKSRSFGKSESGQIITQNATIEPMSGVANNGTRVKTVVVGERLEEKEILPESPDIYDDLKVHKYEEQSTGSPFDLYSEIKNSADDELVELSTLKDSPSSDPNFLYDTSATSEQRLHTGSANNDSLENNSKQEMNESSKQDSDEEVATLTDSKQPGDFELRSDAGTPVMDEPASSISTVVTHQNAPSNSFESLNNGEKSSITREASPGSPPEARTPLLDEPEYNFEPVIPYAQYNPQLAHQSIPDETALSSNHARMDYMRIFGNMEAKQEVFESITPPSSPENELCVLSRTASVSSAGQNASVAFPYSALAFNVNSRPGSRAGSSCHSPLPQGDRSPRSEKIDVTRLSSKRSCERDLSPHTSNLHDANRIQQRDLRRSGSQSSSSSFSKSPEYEYKQRKPFTERHGEAREPSRKQKRGSSSPGYEGSYGKRPRV